jgi:hypothetical protein
MQDTFLRFFHASWTTIRDPRPTNLFKDRESAILKWKGGGSQQESFVGRSAGRPGGKVRIRPHAKRRDQVPRWLLKQSHTVRAHVDIGRELD